MSFWRVDMAAMKSEYLYQNRAKRTMADKAFANFHKSLNYQGMVAFNQPSFEIGTDQEIDGHSPGAFPTRACESRLHEGV